MKFHHQKKLDGFYFSTNYVFRIAFHSPVVVSFFAEGVGTETSLINWGHCADKKLKWGARKNAGEESTKPSDYFYQIIHFKHSSHTAQKR